MKNFVLQVQHLSLQVAHKTLFADFNLQLAPGEKVLLYGDSGSGKSTLLKALLGFYPLASGRIWFQNQQLTPATLQTLRAQTVYLPQQMQIPQETVKEMVWHPFLFRHNKKHKPGNNVLHRWLERFQLSPALLENHPDTLSGGEKQRFLLISALLQNKPLYLLDEPTSALDKELQQVVVDTFIKNPHMSLLISSHDPLWHAAADRVVPLQPHEKQPKK